MSTFEFIFQSRRTGNTSSGAFGIGSSSSSKSNVSSKVIELRDSTVSAVRIDEEANHSKIIDKVNINPIHINKSSTSTTK